MKDNYGQVTASSRRRSTAEGPALQVICLGSGGGPSEDNVTGFLVRSTASEWSKGSLLAVDAGSHLAAIIRMLEKNFPLISPSHHKPQPIDPERAPSPGADAPSENDESNSNDSERSLSPETPVTILKEGPFAGLAFPHASARANAVHVVREHVATYLITHPHLDHLSGFAINTAAFHNTSRPKRLAALPFTVNAIKTHIFNDIIWPNLTDEDNGVGFVTFQRLTEGGNLALGEGNSRGFIEVCDGLAVKGFKVSHGKCASNPRPEHQVRRSSNAGLPQQGGHQHGHSMHTHNHSQSQHNITNNIDKTPNDGGRRSSIFSQPSQPGTPTFYGQQDSQSVVDSTAFFIRADATGKEILIFGDVEPDSISAYPRTHIVWAEAAQKIANGLLNGVFIECSYNDSQRDAVLFGHLAPRHLIAELQTLAEMVAEKRKEMGEKVGRKRKRASAAHASHSSLQHSDESNRRSRSRTQRGSTPMAGGMDELMRDVPEDDIHITPTTHAHNDISISAPRSEPNFSGSDGNLLEVSFTSTTTAPPTGESHDGHLKGVRIIIIHVKDSMADGPLVGDSILQELWAHEAKLASQGKALGCSFEVSMSGNSFWF